jgi:uncharacterized protein YwbE
MKRRLAYGLLLLAASGVAASVLTPAPAAEDLDPLKVAGDTHKLIMENAFVRVIEAKVPAGKLEAKHSHPHGLTIYLADYSIEQKTFPEGKVTKHDRKFGGVVWGEAVVHEVRNTSKTTSHAIRIELKH